MESIKIRTAPKESIEVSLPYYCVKDTIAGKEYSAITAERDNMRLTIYVDGTASIGQITADEINTSYEPVTFEEFTTAYRLAMRHLSEKYRLITLSHVEAA